MSNSGEMRVGVYVDAANISRNGGFGMRYDVLRRFACRGGGTAIRLNVYVGFDEDRAERDHTYRVKVRSWEGAVRDFGYKVIEKIVKWFIDESGNRVGKANADLDMAVDALLQSENLDLVLFLTGDGDFVQVVRSLQNKGCRVEVVAFDNVSHELREEADWFLSGYLIPDLLPAGLEEERGRWGEPGSRVRGVCTNWQQTYGFMRVISDISPHLWITDHRKGNSPYISVFAHESDFEGGSRLNMLPSRSLVYEFDLEKSEKGLVAKRIKLVSAG